MESMLKEGKQGFDVTGFYITTADKLHTGKIQQEPWVPRYNEKIYYKYDKSTEYRIGYFLCYNPRFSQEDPKQYVIISCTGYPTSVFAIKPFRNQILISKDIEDFVKTMNEKLSENNHKPYWDGDDLSTTLYNNLCDELLELGQALYVHNDKIFYEEVMKEAADVGNVAMMIHSNAKRLLEKSKKKE